MSTLIGNIDSDDTSSNIDRNIKPGFAGSAGSARLNKGPGQMERPGLAGMDVTAEDLQKVKKLERSLGAL
jgi:hypothetical protein